VSLARQPDLELADLAGVIGRDPGLAARVLRIANSSFYARRRNVSNLRDALVVLGINAAISLALGFSLVRSLSESRGGAERYTQFWSRSLLAAHAAQEMGRRLAAGLPEDAFLAGLVQDIGILAMDQALGEEYRALAPADGRIDHDALVAAERERFGADHAEVGVWLLERWNLPETLRAAVAASHGSEPVPADDPDAVFCNCIAVSGCVADLWLSPDHYGAIEEARIKAGAWLGLAPEVLGGVVEGVSSCIPEARELYGIALVDEPTRAAILEEAGELLLLHSLRTAAEARENLHRAERLEAHARVVEEQARRDPLTGTFNRRYLDSLLEKEFASASEHGWPLSVVFVDLDHFKKVNDTYGHQVGDRVLASVARLLSAGARQDDIVARYGGEEFVLVLPATGRDAAACMAQRLIEQIAAVQHAEVDHRPIRMTASAGLATHTGASPFPSSEALVRDADAALYSAKVGGRNRVVVSAKAGGL
jgi:diguanylate cyclase (GGDEF)-like protein